MRPTRRAVLLAGAGLFAAGAPVSAAPSCAAPDGFPNPDLLAAMARGVNLPGWDHPGATRRPLTAQLRAVRDAGLTHIRLPLGNRPLEADRNAYLDAMFEQIIALLALDFAVSLDLHPDGRVGELFGRNSGEAQAYLADHWSAIARKARSFDPARVAVELLNEPQAEQAQWMAAAGGLIETVRGILPEHTIVVGPAGPQRHEELAGMTPFSDRNVVYAVHYYDPFAFTHQGADWAGGTVLPYLKDLPYPTSASDPAMVATIARLRADGRGEAVTALENSLLDGWDAASVGKAFDTMAGWSRRHGRPVIVNEFGVLAHVAPRRARLNWLATVREASEARCIGWTHWDFQDGFGLIDPATGLPDEGVMEALGE